MTARSAMTHSYRVLDASATRCSDSMPKAIRPAANRRTRTSVCAQLTDSQVSACGNRNASASGDFVTRSTNRWATERARFSMRERSFCSSLAEKAMVSPGFGGIRSRTQSTLVLRAGSRSANRRQVRVVDQAESKPARKHARAAIRHEGQRQPGHRHDAQVHPDVLEDLEGEPAGDADRDQAAEGVSCPGRDHQRAHDQEAEDQQQPRTPQEAKLLPCHREHEVGLLERDEPALCLTALEQALALPPAGTDRDTDLAGGRA